MSLLIIRQKLEEHLAALNSTAAGPITSIWENVKQDPPKGQPYQKVFLIPFTPENPTFGDDFYRERGNLKVNLYYPTNRTPKDATLRAQAVRAHFYRGLSLTSGGVTVTIEKTPEIAPAFSAEERYVLPVNIRWFANLLGDPGP